MSFLARQAPPQIPPGLANQELPWVNRQSTILGVCIALMVALAVTTAFRLYTRFIVLKKPWWDDLFVIIAFLSFCGISITLCVDTNFGMGHHVFLIPPQNLTKVLKCLYIIGVTYHISTAAIKVSLLFQYLLVFERGTLVYRITQGLLVVCSLWGFTMIFLQAGSCLPHASSYWNGTYKGCYGFGSKNVDVVIRCIQGQAASNFFLDLLVLALAVRLQFEANVQSNRRAMAAILFIGLLSCSFALWRLIEVAKGAGFKTDPTFHQPTAALLSVVELYFATTCATLPFFWPVIVTGWNKIFVSHEFQITETNIVEEELELSANGSLPGRESASGKTSDNKTHTTAPSYSDFSFSDEFGGYGAKKSRGNTTTVKGRK